MKGTLRNRRQYRLVYEKGSKAVGSLLVVYTYEPASTETERVGDDAVGVVASKKVGNAVARARAKRRLREAFRSSRDRIHSPRWVVLIARSGLAARDLSSDRIALEMQQLLQKLGAFRDHEIPSNGDQVSC